MCWGVVKIVIIVNMHYFLFYRNIAHWLLLYSGIIMLLSFAIVEFYLFYNGEVDIQIWALLTRSQWKVSDTQVTMKSKSNWHDFELQLHRCFTLCQKEKCVSFLITNCNVVWFFVEDGPRSRFDHCNNRVVEFFYMIYGT